MVMEELVDKVHDRTNHRRSVIEASTTITIDLIEQTSPTTYQIAYHDTRIHGKTVKRYEHPRRLHSYAQ
jgi:hypothetical protein